MKSNLTALLGTATVMLFFVLLTSNCKKDPTSPFPIDPNIPDSIFTALVNDTLCMDFYLGLKQLPYLQNSAPIPNPTNVGDPTVDDSGNYICTMQGVKWAPEYDELNLLDPKSEVIFPGNLMDANTIPTGGYTPITNVERAPAKISISLLTKPGDKPYETVENPSLSSVREATNTLLHRVADGSTPAFISFDIQSIRAREEAELAIQANFSGWGAKVSSNYSFESNQQKSRFLVRFFQKYYTIDMDLPKTPCSMFKDGQLPGIEVFNGTSPVYVSSVTYGRMVYFMIESDSSSEEMQAALSASFHRFKVGGDLDIEYKYRQTIEQSHISALVIGGNADGAVQSVTGVESLLQFLTADGDFSVTSPGAPIAYTMRYLKDNSVARIVLNSEYTIRNCEVKGEEVTLSTLPGAKVYDGCPVKTHGDNDFGKGGGIKISGTVTLKIRTDLKAVIAEINVTYDESLPNSDPGDTRAEVKDEIVVCELNNSDQYIASILNTLTSEIDYTTNDHGNHHPPFTGDFLKDIITQAGGYDDEDLPCGGYSEDPDQRAFLRILFKNGIKVYVKNL